MPLPLATFHHRLAVLTCRAYSPLRCNFQVARSGIARCRKKNWRLRNRRIGSVFEQFNLLSSLTVGAMWSCRCATPASDRKSGLCLHHRRPSLLGELHSAGQIIVPITQEADVEAAAARTMHILDGAICADSAIRVHVGATHRA
jgi:hypothetical protein